MNNDLRELLMSIIFHEKETFIIMLYHFTLIFPLLSMHDRPFLAYTYTPRQKASLLEKVKAVRKKNKKASTENAIKPKKKRKKPPIPLLTYGSEDTFLFDKGQDMGSSMLEITDYQECTQELQKKFVTNKKEYCDLLNILSSQIAELDPKEQIEIYVILLLNNLELPHETFIFFWKSIENIYTTYLEEEDVEKKIKNHLDNLLETFLIPYVPIMTLEQLEKLYPYLKQHIRPLIQLSTWPQTTDQPFLFTQPYRMLSKKEEPLYYWHNPKSVRLPLATMCYATLSDNNLIAVTRDSALYKVAIKQKNLQSMCVNESQTNQTNIPYFITKPLNTSYIRILEADIDHLPSCVLYAFDHYFFGQNDGTIIIHDADNQFLAKFIGHKKQVSALLDLEDNKKKYIASSSLDRTIKIWKNILGQGHHVVTLKSNYGAVEGLAKTSSDALIALSNKKYFEIWNIHNKRKPKQIRIIETIGSPITSIIGKDCYFISGSTDSSLLMWNPLNGKCVQETELPDKLPVEFSIQKDALVVMQKDEDQQKTILTIFEQKNA